MPISQSFKQLEVANNIEKFLLFTLVSLGPIAREVLDPLPVCKPNQNHILRTVDAYVYFCVQETYFATLP